MYKGDQNKPFSKCSQSVSGSAENSNGRKFSLTLKYKDLKNAFTILEIIVVMVIIAILASMSLAGIQKAREMGRKASCVSNLKQIGFAFSLYLEDHRHLHIINLISEDPATIYWAVHLNTQYIDDENVFYCPSISKSKYQFKAIESDGKGISYGMNSQVLRFTLFDPIRNYDSIDNKSNLFFIADADYAIKSIWANALLTDLPGSMAVSDIHNGGSNVLYYDLHVEWHLESFMEDNYPGMWKDF